MDFSPSERTRDLQAALEAFMAAEVYPREEEFFAEVAENRRKGNPWVPTKTVEVLKEKARAQKLWNLFLPDTEGGGSAEARGEGQRPGASAGYGAGLHKL